MLVYSDTKLAQVVFTRWLARQLVRHGKRNSGKMFVTGVTKPLYVITRNVKPRTKKKKGYKVPSGLSEIDVEGMR